jgi:hypothetical protein
MGHVCVTLGRQTERPLLERGEPGLPLARAAHARLHGAPQLSEEQRERLHTPLTAALAAPHRIEHPSRQLTQGKAVPHGNIVNAYDPTIAPSWQGQSHGPAQFGRTPGLMAEPAAGFSGARQRPVMRSP